MKNRMVKSLFSCILMCVILHGYAQSKQQPNIIFIMADDLGWGELGCYGNTFNETPNLDKLAREGLKFTQAYAAAAICSPTRASIVTGQYPARVKITDFLPAKTNRWLDPDKHVTINEALSLAGYHTGMFGKWHLDTDYKNNRGGPKAHGFDEVIGTETKYIADGDYFFPYDKISTFTEGSENEFLTDRLSSEVADFIKRNHDKPFFAHVAYYSVHTKLDAPEQIVNKYKKKFDAKYGEGAAARVYGENNPRHEGDHLDNPYLAAMLERIDAGVGRIMQTLRETGLEQNTLVIFFSDNGGAGKFANNGPFRAGKSWLYEGGIRECLLMKWPRNINAGSITDAPVYSVDFYPTFLEAAKAAKPAQFLDGISMVPIFSGKPFNGRQNFFWHYPSETGKWKPRMASAVRSGDFKLIKFYLDGRSELYNIKEDPSEKNNLSVTMPAKVKELDDMLERWKKDVDAEEPDIQSPSK